MKIAIEAQRIFRKNKHGMDFVALETIRQLQQIDRKNEYYILVADGEDRCLEESNNFHIVSFSAPGGYPVWEQILLPAMLKRISPDLLHCTSNTAPVFCSVPLVLTLHDIIFLEKLHAKNQSMYQNMGRTYRRLVVPRILEKCKKIITVSNFERNRIKGALNMSSDKIVAIHNGYGAHFVPLENPYEVSKKYIAAEKYIFFIGNTDPKKNTSRTILAYSIYASKSTSPLPLLLADMSEDRLSAILKELDLQWLAPNIVLSGYIDNKDLPSIYNSASVFLYTSLRESFGIPILESMACGTPIITSNTSAIPEVAGEGAIMVNPTNEHEIADQLLRLECDEVYRASKIEYGLTRANCFSWRKTASDLLALYEALDKKQVM